MFIKNFCYPIIECRHPSKCTDWAIQKLNIIYMPKPNANANRVSTRSHDRLTYTIVRELLERYIDQLAFITRINAGLHVGRQIRAPHFPSEISESLVKFCLSKRTGILCDWNVVKGDLCLVDKRIEVKGFMSDAPMTFGPRENWDWIYFVDCRRYADRWFTVYELRVSNTDARWRAIPVNLRQSFGDQCAEGRRPRLKFDRVLNAFAHSCVKIFDGTIDGLK